MHNKNLEIMKNDDLKNWHNDWMRKNEIEKAKADGILVGSIVTFILFYLVVWFISSQKQK